MLPRNNKQAYRKYIWSWTRIAKTGSKAECMQLNGKVYVYSDAYLFFRLITLQAEESGKMYSCEGDLIPVLALSHDEHVQSPDVQASSPDVQVSSPDVQAASLDVPAPSPYVQAPRLDEPAPSPDVQAPSPDEPARSPDVQANSSKCHKKMQYNSKKKPLNNNDFQIHTTENMLFVLNFNPKNSHLQNQDQKRTDRKGVAGTAYLLGNKGAHMYNGNIILKCSDCKKIFKSAKTLHNHKCQFCKQCGRQFSSYQRLIGHNCIKNAFYMKSKAEPITMSHRNYSISEKESNDDQCKSVSVAETSSVSVNLIRQSGVLIPDEIITVALDIIRQYTGSHFHGHITPAEMALFLTDSSLSRPPVPPDTSSINIHNIADHWVTSIYSPDTSRISVYDSLYRIEHVYQILPQIKLLYGTQHLDRIDFIPVTQQGSDPSCGAFAIAFAFSLCLGIPPESQNFDVAQMRMHLNDCIKYRKLKAFPTVISTSLTEARKLNTTVSENGFEKSKECNPETSWKLWHIDERRKRDANRKRRQRESMDFRIKENAKKRLNENSKQRAKLHKRKIREQLDERSSKCKAKRMNFNVKAQSKSHKKKVREDPAKREAENKAKRMNPYVKIQSKRHKKDVRENSAERNAENEAKRMKSRVKTQSKNHKKEVREDSAKRDAENKAKRMNPNAKTKSKIHKRKIREDSGKRDAENKAKKMNLNAKTKSKIHKREVREDSAKRDAENKAKRMNLNAKTQSKIHKREVREDSAKRDAENKAKRLNPNNRRQAGDHKRQLRDDSEVREAENAAKRRNLDSRYWEKEHKQLTRQNAQQKTVESQSKQQKKQVSISQLISDFHKSVQDCPLYICTCCGQMFYRESVRLVPKHLIVEENLEKKLLTGVRSVEDKEWICHTCYSSVKNKLVPTCAIANLMTFPTKPSEMELIEMEERLVAPRIPFMSLHQLPRGGQLSLHGNAVNVPADVNKTVLKLPRSEDENDCIPIKLKRKLSYKHHVDFRNIRPNKVLTAVNWLVRNSQLYKEEGVVLNEAWFCDAKIDTNDDITNENDSEDKIDNDTWGEADDDALPSGNLDTLLVPQDITDEARRVFSVAPAEGNSPVSIFMDKHAEELAFPSLFCGKARPDNKDRQVKVSCSDICKSELRQSDRRMAGHIPNIFFKYKKLQTKHILDKANLCIRKTKGSQDLTAAFFKSAENIEKLCRHDEGYRVFKDLRGSPPYWEQAKKDIFAMIRRLGIPTWFMSFSSAETRWTHLLQILSKSVHNKSLTEQEVSELSWHEKSELIKKDPVTCARHFDHQVKKLVNNVLQNSQNPVGKVVDFFYKVEFQMRGSPHIHMLAWTEGAPILDETKESKVEVTRFVDEHIICSRDDSIEHLVSLQQHTHSRTCQKRNKKECRFGFPMPPMPETSILEPLEPETNEDDKKVYKKNWEKIKKKLDEMKSGEEMEFRQFLETLHMTKEDYIAAVRSPLVSTKIFIKRNTNEIRINNYNHVLLKCWRANMDIQYVLDPYSCAVYIVTYITKAQRGMSMLLFNATKEVKEGNMDIRNQVRSIGHKFLTHVEVSAQEAVYFVLQLPLKNSPRDVVFINTSPENERVVVLKSLKIIQNLPDDSTEVETTSIVKRYADRPRQLEETCLAEFCSWFKVEYKGKLVTVDHQEESESLQSETTLQKEQYLCEDGTTLKRRRRPIVIRYVRYQQQIDSENYFREVLMLFYPWRREANIIGQCESYQKRLKILNY